MKLKFDIYDWTVRRGMLLAGLLMAAAIVVSLCAPMWVVVAVVILIPVSLLIGRIRRIVPIFCIAILIVGLLCGVAYRLRVVESVVALDGCSDTVTGVVIEKPSDSTMYTIRVTASEIVPADSRVLLYCSDLVAPSLYDEVTATVVYRTLFDNQNFHRADGVFLQAFPTTFDENCVLSRPTDYDEWRTVLRPLREELSRNITSMLTGSEGGLLTAVCFGDKSHLNAHVSDVFRASGLSHLLAVSGLHMSVIAGGTHVLMRLLRIKRVVGDLITAVIIVLFMWIVEFTPSVTRAGIMYLVMILGRTTRFQTDSLNSLGLALVMILTVSPSSIYDIGLWLSFIATVGALCVAPRLYSSLMRPFMEMQPLIRIPVKWLVGGVSVSVGCTLPLLLIMLFVFGEVSLISPVSNLFTVVPAGWMTILGCFGAVISSIPFVSFLGKGMIFLSGLLAKWLISVSECCAAVPGAVFRPTSLWIIIFVGGAGVVVSVAIMRLSFRRVCALICAVISTFIVALPIYSYLVSGRYIMGFSTDAHGTVAVVDDGKSTVAIMNNAASIYTLSSLLNTLRSDRLSLLVVNRCQTAHEAYLAELKREFPFVEIACAECDEGAEWLDYLLKRIERIDFNPGCSLSTPNRDFWTLSIGESQCVLSMSDDVDSIPDLPPDSAALIYAESVGENVTLDADVVFCSAESEKYSVRKAEGIHVFSEGESVFIATFGDGRWMWMRRIFNVLV